jgi:large subunit ribosomal protein L3
MVQGLIGKKLGMVQIFDESGQAVGVTVVEAGPCMVIRKKPNSRVQLGYGSVKESKASMPQIGQFKHIEGGPYAVLKEFKVVDPEAATPGLEVKADIFQPGEKVKVTGTSKGKGFAGTIKRHNFGGGRASHGSRSHRIPGAVGQCAYPARIFKGKRMPGRLGGTQVTSSSVQVLQVRPDDNLVFLKGPIPGANGGIVFIRKK